MQIFIKPLPPLFFVRQAAGCEAQAAYLLLRLPFLLLPPTGYCFGQPGNTGSQGFQLALDAHQQIRSHGYGKSDIAHCLQD
jgi:hypothetical protein